MADNVVHLTKENFDEVIASNEPVLVDFWATWCPPCRMIGPLVEQLASEYEGKAKICKLDVDAQPELAAKFQVETIPTLIVFKDGDIKEREIGARPKHAIAEMVDRHM